MSSLQFVQEVKDVTRDRFVECEKSGWFAKAGGCKAVIKQRAGTVLMAVLELKDFVSEGLKYDVTGYGATAWSIITFGLRADLDRTQSIFEASAFLADLLARYASILLSSKTSQQPFPETE
ncbi:hypothetical protein J4E86_001909 [Alternaria arbusti]|uniref:uncharacterized protein n=1 Tax=Alternaria arbusti TaxID=232088 RepID=UPI00221F9DD7|nr:uncharacterized protein J4E86_001909 [Alternaria arbusti]KAI4960287.1 hypothetical protein J4E86_001909 [Alternaria arbusti]